MILAFVPAGMPPESWVLFAVILCILGVTAAVDARRGIVPDMPLAIGAVSVVVGLGLYGNAILALQALGKGLAAGAVVWGINEIYFRLRGQEALGMGDAKWTVLAVATFGVAPGLVAWGVGAWLALGWLGVRRFILRRTAPHLHFAPFLFGGLVLALIVSRYMTA